jgi:hypothetical protein
VHELRRLRSVLLLTVPVAVLLCLAIIIVAIVRANDSYAEPFVAVVAFLCLALVLFVSVLLEPWSKSSAIDFLSKVAPRHSSSGVSGESMVSRQSKVGSVGSMRSSNIDDG